MAVAEVFEWEAAANGYTWAGEDAPRLVEVRAALGDEPRQPPGRRYRPFVEEPTLFRVFADLPTPLTEEAVLDFANRYGGLGADGEWEPVARVEGEKFATWAAEHEAIQDMVPLADALAAGDEPALTTFARRLRRDRNLRLGVEARLRDDLVPMTPSDTPSGRRARAEAYLAHALDGRLAVMVEACLELRAGDEQAGLVHRPRHLLGALWLQLAVAIAERKTYRRCEHCGAWMEITPGVGRADRRFCTTACRMRAHRARQQQTRALVAQGLRDGGDR